MTRPRPHLVRLERTPALEVWRVDGHLVRDQIDVEFTNGSHHFTRGYVPHDQIWIDRDAPGAEEWPYWVLHQHIERARMEKGDSYLRALWVASREEQRQRRADLGLPRKLDPREVADVAKQKVLGERTGRTVWLVDGKAVRDLACVDFTLGGHGYRYRFISRREIWIDNAVRPSEREAILCHEAVEVGLMAQGMRYDQAHARASEAERRCRRAQERERPQTS